MPKGKWIGIWICFIGLSGVSIAQPPDTVRVQILHSNDVYGQLLRQGVDGDQKGGMAARVHLIRRLQKEYPTMVLDAGDALGPGTLSAWDVGKTMIGAMRLAGYTAMVPGNHEFDYGLSALSERRKEGAFPFLAVNLRGKQQKELPFEGYRTEIVEGVKIGLIGVVSASLQSELNPNVASEMVFEDPVERAREGVMLMRDLGADYIVALVHMDASDAMELAQHVAGIDLVVSGGYRGLERPNQVPALTRLADGTQLVTTPRGGSYLGRVVVTFVRQKGGSHRASETRVDLVPVGGEVPDDADAKALIDVLESAYETEIGDALGRISGKTLDQQAGVVANLMRWHTKMEIGVIHRGAFRERSGADSLLLRDVNRFVRFDGTLVKMRLSGQELKTIVRRSNRTRGENKLIFAGLDTRSMTVNGRSIENKEPYEVVTIMYLAEGGSGYRDFRKARAVQWTGISLRSLLVGGLKVWGTLSSEAFEELGRRRVWRSGWSIEGAFRRNYIDQTAEVYRQQRERVSFLRGETSIAWNAATRYSLSYDAGLYVVVFENNNDFGQVGGSFGDLETSSDRFDAEMTYRRRIKKYKVDPFLSSGVNTAFTSGNGSRPFQIRTSVGFQRQVGRLVVQFAGRGQRDFVESQTDFGAEVSLNYQRRLSQGGRVRSRIKSFFGFTDRKVISIENYNTLSFPLAGALSLTVRQNNFIYWVDQIRGVKVSGIAFRTDLTVGLAYGLDWKWF